MYAVRLRIVSKSKSLYQRFSKLRGVQVNVYADATIKHSNDVSKHGVDQMMGNDDVTRILLSLWGFFDFKLPCLWFGRWSFTNFVKGFEDLELTFEIEVEITWIQLTK